MKHFMDTKSHNWREAGLARQISARAVKRARLEFVVLFPALAGVLLVYRYRQDLFGVDMPVRLATVIALVILGWSFARDVGRAAGPDVDLAHDAFPYMTVHEGEVAGVPARLCRISFTGELSYELHVSPLHPAHVWEAVMAAGAPFDITPYGTEAMHVLRAEKGYVIVGQDTDGQQTPDDLGLSWIVNTGKGDFVGKRSLVRSDVVRPDRKHLVGLFPADPDLVLAEGTQLLDGSQIPEPPAHMLGWVTSSYRSEALGRSIALALVERGRGRSGETIHAVMGRSTVPCTIVDPVFYDPEGARRDG
jgi:sarcosine oxidase subunit alpha